MMDKYLIVVVVVVVVVMEGRTDIGSQFSNILRSSAVSPAAVEPLRQIVWYEKEGSYTQYNLIVRQGP